jgi:uncharacterized protein YqjF (DUF2071 family)
MPNPFLTARWANLLMANYEVGPEALQPYLPRHTELDTWQGRHYVSLVGFMFLETRVMGLKIPFHVNFEEVNLRFYVRYRDGQTWKRGAVFVNEIVPKPAIAWVANVLYGEKYRAMPMKHEHQPTPTGHAIGYHWRYRGRWNGLSAQVAAQPSPIPAGSEAEFITEHYWGYAKRGGQTTEYQVSHPRWREHLVRSFQVDCAFGELYGPAFAHLPHQPPTSVLLAEGSDVAVHQGRRLG